MVRNTAVIIMLTWLSGLALLFGAEVPESGAGKQGADGAARGSLDGGSGAGEGT